MIDFVVLLLFFIGGFVCGGLVTQAACNREIENGFYYGNGKVYSVKPVDIERLKND